MNTDVLKAECLERCRQINGHRGFGGMSGTSVLRTGELSAYIQGLFFYNANSEVRFPPETYATSCMTAHYRKYLIVDSVRTKVSKCLAWPARSLMQVFCWLLAFKTTTRKLNCGAHREGSNLHYVQDVHEFRIYSDIVQITCGQHVLPCESITSR